MKLLLVQNIPLGRHISVFDTAAKLASKVEDGRYSIYRVADEDCHDSEVLLSAIDSSTPISRRI